ncbi:MAG: DMT family transporter [Chloroflexota bacterium]
MVRQPTSPGPDRDRAIGVGLVLAAACLYGSGPVFARIAYDAGMSPLPLLTWRYVFAAIVGWLLLLAMTGGRRSLRTLTARDLMVLVALGLLFVGNAGAYTAALQTVPAGLVAIIMYIYPALVAVISVRYARRLEGRRPWVALALSTAGVALAVGGIPGVPTSRSRACCSPRVCRALCDLDRAGRADARRATGRGRRRSPSLPRPARRTRAAPAGPGTLASSAVMTTATALTAAILSALLADDLAPAAVPAAAWPALVGFGAFSAAAVVAFLAGTHRIGAARAALVSTIEPVYTIVVATLLLHETLDPVQVAGGTLVVIGVLLAESGRTGRDGDAATDMRETAGPEGADRATV